MSVYIPRWRHLVVRFRWDMHKNHFFSLLWTELSLCSTGGCWASLKPVYPSWLRELVMSVLGFRCVESTNCFHWDISKISFFLTTSSLDFLSFLCYLTTLYGSGSAYSTWSEEDLFSTLWCCYGMSWLLASSELYFFQNRFNFLPLVSDVTRHSRDAIGYQEVIK